MYFGICGIQSRKLPVLRRIEVGWVCTAYDVSCSLTLNESPWSLINGIARIFTISYIVPFWIEKKSTALSKHQLNNIHEFVIYY